ncbi:hypothetical protein [Streptomyces sp. VNUA74]|uniref:hypothetical protein n=1 Tax=Streptomyces sp. VNUA74 TaxID=3062685 RepID=UPI00280AFE40|nr:hypothetical protein [Streptomyces sp. VNUA74]WML79163.1 hypothetical protein Q3101_04620 [Streptomyces sp. VNUA74]
MNRKTASWRFSSLVSGYERVVPLELRPEINFSSMLIDYEDESGEEQFRRWVKCVQHESPKQWADDAVSILWGVVSPGNNFTENAPFQNHPFWTRSSEPDNFLKHFTWPIHERTGERLDWFQLPVVNDRFKEWAKALNWTPSPLQATCPLRSIVQSRNGVL